MKLDRNCGSPTVCTAPSHRRSKLISLDTTMIVLLVVLLGVGGGSAQCTTDSADSWESSRTTCDLHILQDQIKDLVFLMNGPHDCTDVSALGNTQSGVYSLSIAGKKVDAYCDLKTSNSTGWLVIQRRQNGKTDFFRGWRDYQRGFGSLTDEFWFGNENLYKLTTASGRKYKLRVDLMDWNDNTVYAEYATFAVGSSGIDYQATVLNYSGNAGDSMADCNQQKFSTIDHDVDHYVGSCAYLYSGAWWYNSCDTTNLNGKYFINGNHTSFADGIDWYHWKGFYYSMKFTEMKIALAE